MAGLYSGQDKAAQSEERTHTEQTRRGGATRCRWNSSGNQAGHQQVAETEGREWGSLKWQPVLTRNLFHLLPPPLSTPPLHFALSRLGVGCPESCGDKSVGWSVWVTWPLNQKDFPEAHFNQSSMSCFLESLSNSWLRRPWLRNVSIFLVMRTLNYDEHYIVFMAELSFQWITVLFLYSSYASVNVSWW